MGNSYTQEKNQKGLITFCSNCQAATEPHEITIEFERKGVQAVMSGIPAMVCPTCGEEYVPGDVAVDVIDVVSHTIDETEALLKRTASRRREFAVAGPPSRPERLELALVA